VSAAKPIAQLAAREITAGLLAGTRRECRESGFGFGETCWVFAVLNPNYGY
jgi:hypothetical protein